MTPLNSSCHSVRSVIDSRVGSIINNKWEILKVLGVGGMAIVYLAKHCTNGRTAALKVLRPELSQIPEVRERFYNEAIAANAVPHEGAVAILDDGEIDGYLPYHIMDYLEGETVEQLRRRSGGRLPTAKVLDITINLLDILHAAHENGVFHRDIKPDNIFITFNGEIKLFDFGIAKAEAAGPAQYTQIGSTMGTLAYMPPEQARGQWDKMDERSDLFSVAATMYSLISGAPVHSGETGNELLLAAMRGNVPSVRSALPHLPSELCAIIDRGLRFSKEDRFASAEEMRESLVTASRLLSPQKSTAQLDQVGSRSRSSRIKSLVGSLGRTPSSLDGRSWGIAAAAILAMGYTLATANLDILSSSPVNQVTGTLERGELVDQRPELDSPIPDLVGADDQRWLLNDGPILSAGVDASINVASKTTLESSIESVGKKNAKGRSKKSSMMKAQAGHFPVETEVARARKARLIAERESTFDPLASRH